jgi:hypothetical protein
MRKTIRISHKNSRNHGTFLKFLSFCDTFVKQALFCDAAVAELSIM